MSPQMNSQDIEVKKHFEASRISGGPEHAFLTLIYSPLGIILSVLRLCMLFHVYIVSFLLPIHVPVCRAMLRFMLVLCGLSVRVKGEQNRRDTCPVIACNYISPVDRVVLSLTQPNIMANEWGLPPFLSWIIGLKDLNEENSRETFLQNAKTLCQETSVPLFTRPEGLPTSGKHALLKFSTWQFSISNSVQPVVIEAKRPLPISLTTLKSSGLSDIFWFIFTPYTLYTVRYLPVVIKGEDDSPEEFAECVREKMAAALNISCSQYSRHDRNELVKRLSYNNGRRRAADSDGGRGACALGSAQCTSQPLVAHLEEMVRYCKDVVPQVPLDVLRADIARTKDSSATLSNILEGNIEYEPEPERPPSQPLSCLSKRNTPTQQLSSSHSPDMPPPSSAQTYAASVFEKRSNRRELSLADRKKAMLTEARLRYIKIHGLSITLEQIESGRF